MYKNNPLIFKELPLTLSFMKSHRWKNTEQKLLVSLQGTPIRKSVQALKGTAMLSEISFQPIFSVILLHSWQKPHLVQIGMAK
jgi:hypothetical protein